MGQSKKIVVLVSGTLSVLVLLRVVTVSPYLVDTVVSCCTYPFIVAQNWIVTPLQRATERRKTVEDLTFIVREYQQLLDEARVENIALKAAQTELNQTAEQTEFAQRYKTDRMVLTQVILKQFSQSGHFFLVDAGTNRGITVDMIAVYNNCLVGRVVEVHPWYSKVILITDCLSSVPVVCATTHTHGIHEGAHSLTHSKLEFVSHLQPLQQGDLIISSGDGLIYPKGFALGKVAEFSLNSLGLNYVVSVELLLNLQEVDHCYLVAKGAEYQS